MGTPRADSTRYCSRVWARNRSCQPPTSRVGAVDAVQRGAALQRGPERVGHIRMLQPALEPRGPGPEQVPAAGRDGQPVQRGTQPPVGGGHPPQAGQPSGGLLVGDHVAPAQEVLQVERAMVVGGLAEVVRPDVDHGRDQFRWRILGQCPLHEAEIAEPVGGQPAVEPVLLAQPGHRVLAVSGLMAHRVELAAGAERAAAALQQHVEAPLGDRAGRSPGWTGTRGRRGCAPAPWPPGGR